MDVKATQNDINALRLPESHWYGLFGGRSDPGGNTDTLTNLVDADSGVTVIVAPRPTAATSGAVPPTPLDTFPGFNSLALLGKANNTNIATLQGADVTTDSQDPLGRGRRRPQRRGPRAGRRRTGPYHPRDQRHRQRRRQPEPGR